MTKKINSSSFDIQNTWINEVAPNYFDVNDLSMLRVGLFGYVNEIQSNGLEDTVNMMNIISNEVYPNKAVLPNSIYSYSALADFDEYTATPSKIKFTLALNKKNLIKYITSNNTDTYKISRFSRLNIGDLYDFTIEYDIHIRLKKKSTDKDYTITAQYDLTVKNPISNIVNPYINTKTLMYGGEEYVFLNLSANQVTKSEFNFMVTSNDLIESIKYDVDYDGQLSHFNVFYKPNNGEMIQLEKYYVDSIKPKEKYFCFYQYTAEGQLSISFSANTGYFKPEFNSSLTVEVYTTKGEEGNFVYNGDDVKFLFFKDENSGNIDSRITNYSIIMGNAEGGKDALNIEEIKYNYIKAFSVRKNIISDNDLNYYFKEIMTNSKMLFIKKRDDLIKRIYSAYLLLRNNKNEIIPTNTIDLIINGDEFDDDTNYSGVSSHKLKPGRVFQYSHTDNEIDIYRVMDKDITVDEIIEMDLTNNENGRVNYYYTCPYLLRINENPHFISYYLNSVYDEYTLSFKDISAYNENEFIITKCKLERNAIKEDFYKFRFILNTDLPVEKVCEIDKFDPSVILEDYNNLITKIVLKQGDESYIGSIDCEMVEIIQENYEDNQNLGVSILYEATIYTDDYINEDDSIMINDSINKLYRTSTFVKMEECVVPSDNVFMEILVLYKNNLSSDKLEYEELLPIELDEYCLTNIFLSNEPIQLFKDVNNIEYSTLTLLNNENSESLDYKMLSIPVIRYLYVENDSLYKEFINLINYFRVKLQETLTVIENNFDIDTKYYNTYGPSKYFEIGRNKEKLESTCLKISLIIKINEEFNLDIKNEIEKFIIDYIESINNKESVNSLYISKLIQELQTKFKYINYIEFNGFNDNDSSLQIIENVHADITKLSNKQIIKYVPEYLNVSKFASYSEDDSDDYISFLPEVYIQYLE